MSDLALEYVESGLQFARARSSVLAEDAANAGNPTFTPQDAVIVADQRADGSASFAAALRDAGVRGAVGTLEFAMGAQAKNAVVYRALADQEHAILHELRTVAEEARR